MDSLETKLISIYLIVCDAWDQGVFVSAQRFSNNNRYKWTDQEIMTMYLFGILNGRETKKEIYEFCRDYWYQWFPSMKSYAAFSYRLNILQSAFIGLNEYVAFQFDKEYGEEFRKLVDAMPIVMAKAKRSNRASVAGELADKGYCASKGEYYYGVKLHVVGYDRDDSIPIPSLIGLSPASVHDLSAFRQIETEFKNCDIFADNAYTASHLFAKLAQENVYLVTPVKKQRGQKTLDSADKMYSTAVASIRQPIESLFNWLQEKTKIQRASKVRSSKGLITHIFGKFAAGMIALLLNV